MLTFRTFKQLNYLSSNVSFCCFAYHCYRPTLNITEHFNCTTPIFFYCIQCSNSNMIYIGETGHHLGDRIRDHLYDIRKNDQSKPLSRYLNSSNHSISDFVAFGLSIINGGNDCRKTREMRVIHALGTLLTFCCSGTLLSFKQFFFSQTSLYFYFLLFLHIYLIALSCFTSLYKHLFICNPCIHSNERLQSETSVF